MCTGAEVILSPEGTSGTIHCEVAVTPESTSGTQSVQIILRDGAHQGLDATVHTLGELTIDQNYPKLESVPFWQVARPDELTSQPF